MLQCANSLSCLHLWFMVVLMPCSHGEGAVLEVKAHNVRAIRLYQRHGFQEVGRRRRFYADGSDALLMSRMTS